MTKYLIIWTTIVDVRLSDAGRCVANFRPSGAAATAISGRAGHYAAACFLKVNARSEVSIQKGDLKTRMTISVVRLFKILCKICIEYSNIES